MDFEDTCDFFLTIICVFEAYKIAKKFKKRKSRKLWVRKVNLNRKIEGFFEKNFEIIKTIDSEQFLRATRMSSEVFDTLFELLKDDLTKVAWREPISPKCRLFLTLL